MKILVLSNFGMGLYKFRKELLETFIERKDEVYLSFPGDEYVPLFEKMGCIFVESNLDRRGTNPISDLKLLIRYLKILSQIKPDIVLTYTIKPNVYGGMACRIMKKPYLSNVTGLGTSIENEGLMQKLALFLYKLGLKKSKCVFFQNESNKKFFLDKKIVSKNSQVIPGSGVNLVQHCYEDYPEEPSHISLLFIGRIMKDKGIDELLEVAKRIRKLSNAVEFHLIGFCEEAYAEELKEMTNKGIINYHGQQKNVHEFIKNAHAIVLPSYHEGTSNVLLESASTGRPVLASNIPGCKETFEDGVSGIGFEVKSITSLYEAIIKFIDLPHSKKREMGMRGREKMEREYDRQIVIESYLNQINK